MLISAGYLRTLWRGHLLADDAASSEIFDDCYLSSTLTHSLFQSSLGRSFSRSETTQKVLQTFSSPLSMYLLKNIKKDFCLRLDLLVYINE